MNEKLILGYSNWVEPEYMKKNQEIVDKFNEKWKEPDTFVVRYVSFVFFYVHLESKIEKLKITIQQPYQYKQEQE